MVEIIILYTKIIAATIIIMIIESYYDIAAVLQFE